MDKILYLKIPVSCPHCHQNNDYEYYGNLDKEIAITCTHCGTTATYSTHKNKIETIFVVWLIPILLFLNLSAILHHKIMAAIIVLFITFISFKIFTEYQLKKYLHKEPKKITTP